MHILLVGSGNMAKAVIEVACSRNIILTQLVSDSERLGQSCGKPVAIHFGSGRHLLALIEYCEKVGMPIIQGSTKLDVLVPDHLKTVIINAPNLSLPMIRFVAAFPAFATAIRAGMHIEIVESHQSKKVDTSGTARAIAGALDIPEMAIKTIRHPGVQLALGVPKEHLDGHAYHDFIFSGQGVEIKVSTKIRGRATYAEGALVLAQALADQPEPLKAGVYELKDILHLLPKV